MDQDKLITELTRDEGLRLKPYRDSVGKLTIGVGRNLDDRGISNDEATELLVHDIENVLADLDTHLAWWRSLDGTRQRALANMCFNLGINKLLLFMHFLDDLAGGDYDAAATEMLNSKWASQVMDRANRLSEMIRNGDAGAD